MMPVDGVWYELPAKVQGPVTRTMQAPQYLDFQDRTGQWYLGPPAEPLKEVEKEPELPPTSLLKQPPAEPSTAFVVAEKKQAAVKECVRCRKHLTEDALFCDSCGYKYGVKECARCHAELTEDSLFCGSCGQRCDAVPFPDAHQLYDYGIRTQYFSRCVPVPEYNHGVMINEEHVLQPAQERVLFNRDDGAIRNRGWYYTGPLLKRADDADEPIDQWLAHHADWKKAYDITGVKRIPEKAGPKRAQGYKAQPEKKVEEFHDVLERKSFTPQQLQEHLQQRQRAQYLALKSNGRLLF